MVCGSSLSLTHVYSRAHLPEKGVSASSCENKVFRISALLPVFPVAATRPVFIDRITRLLGTDPITSCYGVFISSSPSPPPLTSVFVSSHLPGVIILFTVFPLSFITLEGKLNRHTGEWFLKSRLTVRTLLQRLLGGGGGGGQKGRTLIDPLVRVQTNKHKQINTHTHTHTHTKTSDITAAVLRK